MKVKNILSLACSFIGEEEIADLIETMPDDERIAKLLKIFNLVRNEVASEFLPVLESEELDIKDFKLPFSAFKFKPLKIIMVKDRFGRKLKFRAFPDYLMVQASRAKVTYSYQPAEVNLEDEIDDNLPERVYAYGVAREYLMREGMFEDAEIFEVRFKNSLQVLLRKNSSTFLARRRWV